jgi:Ca-activated chloride channel family protein
LASPGSPADGFIVARPVGDGHSGAVLEVPDAPQLLEARLLMASAGGVLSIIARSSVEVVRAAAELEVPASVETGTEFEIDWSGPGNTGDQLMLVPTNPVLVASTVAPLEPGAYTLQYVAGLTQRVVSSRNIDLFQVLARLSAPDTTFAGEEFQVTWEGPGAPDDFLSITRPDAPDTTYESWTGSLPESPTTLTAPTEPGTWELRYVATDGTVLARCPLGVEIRPVELEAPDTVLAGTRVSVTWTGPDGPGDLIVIAPVGAPPRRILDWATTSAGSPASVAAPFDPGDFEIRYLRGSDHVVVASRPLTVR